MRFYTYISTMIVCLEAAAEKGIEFVVLDRPNPLGGERIEGPVPDPRETVPASMVNTAPGPLVHGLTAAEMARYVNGKRARKAKLKVVEMKGWRRSMVWNDTGRAWVNPSPNLRSPDAAIAYPGIALLEATNVSEGRGSEDPFLLFGAPWLRTAPLAVQWNLAHRQRRLGKRRCGRGEEHERCGDQESHDGGDPDQGCLHACSASRVEAPP